MKNLKILFLLIITLFSSLNSLLAQNTKPTPYQKKQLELSKKWFQFLTGYELTMADEAFYEQLASGKESNDFVLGLAVLNYATQNSQSQCKKVFTQMNNEFKLAEKLKNSTDFRLEKEQKLRTEQAEYEKTDIGSIQKNIKIEFEKWNKKGEFEKEIDYAERLKTQSQTTFESICLEQITSKIKNYDYYNWQKDLSAYNSENEFFIVTFKTNGLEWQSKINMPISNAQKFKNDWYDFKFEIDDYSWCVVETKLCPSLVKLVARQEINSKYEFPLTLKNKSDISFNFDKLEINNTYLKGYVFNYLNAKSIAEQVKKERQRLDSLKLASYNIKLDSIFKNYNILLLQNPYNVNQKVLTDFKKVENVTEMEYNYNKSISYIKTKYAQLNDNFEKELKSTNPTEYCKIYYTQNPIKKTEADKKYIECSCNYPQRVNFDIKFIEGNLYNCDCRERQYQKNGYLFLDKKEFDSFYDKGDDILQKEIEARILKKEEEKAIFEITSNSQQIERLDFKAINLKSSDDDLAFNYFQKINDYKNKPYYAKVVDTLIENNKDLKKEWTKKGELFSNKVEFYEAFTSGNYKKILKDKK